MTISSSRTLIHAVNIFHTIAENEKHWITGQQITHK